MYSISWYIIGVLIVIVLNLLENRMYWLIWYSGKEFILSRVRSISSFAEARIFSKTLVVILTIPRLTTIARLF